MNDKSGLGVSAVIGVILMIAITVAIAGTVYVYVSGFHTVRVNVDSDDNVIIMGNVTKIKKFYNNNLVSFRVWFDYNISYCINGNFDWKLGRFYELYLVRDSSDYCYDIHSCAFVVGELE